ncbi:Serine/threonine-protein kinase Sgk1 [Portunus trituberculatus]|uniref:Serine/threonine-protein kinase Sgk1 n=1 Tax=Portunus trituberculatus TaxID=210409 RepID=A0A5B7DXZ0_PORTR|nr:Serine/threonine-protein kinase Sgk1 [Portunus trituberculatus]
MTMKWTATGHVFKVVVEDVKRCWFVLRRYNEFLSLHRTIMTKVSQASVDLPSQDTATCQNLNLFIQNVMTDSRTVNMYGIVYRDLKPENILLDAEGHVVLTDFGLCKEGLVNPSARTNTFCGTPEYLAPEILKKQPYSRAVDWWTLGAVLYEMLYGLPPFYSRDTPVMYDAILNKPLKLKPSATQKARTLLQGLLQKEPNDRLGSGARDGEEVKEQEFFRTVDWDQVARRAVPPPFVPVVSGPADTRNVDPTFTKEAVMGQSPPTASPNVLSASVQAVDHVFQGFSYAPPLEIEAQ